MKKKLNLYCLLFIFAVGFGITINFVAGFKDMKIGFMEAWKGESAEWGKEDPDQYNIAHVTFRPKSFSKDNKLGKDSIYNEITKEKEPVSYNSVDVYISKEKSPSPALSGSLIGIGSILHAIGIIGFWIVFFKAIRSVKHGDVFLLSVASYLTKAAIFLLIVYIGEWVLTWANFEYTKEMVEITNYEIVPDFLYNNSNLYMAFGLLLLSQIIKHGNELKEEQELTI